MTSILGDSFQQLYIVKEKKEDEIFVVCWAGPVQSFSPLHECSSIGPCKVDLNKKQVSWCENQADQILWTKHVRIAELFQALPQNPSIL